MAMINYPELIISYDWDITLEPGDELYLEFSYQPRNSSLAIRANGPFELVLVVFDYQSRWRGVRITFNLVRQGSLHSAGLYSGHPTPTSMPLDTRLVGCHMPSESTLDLDMRNH